MLDVESAKSFKSALDRVDLEEVSVERNVLLENLPLYQKLFRLKYREGVVDLEELCNHLGLCDVEEVDYALRVLIDYLKGLMGGTVRKDKISEVCPECLELSIRSFGKDGEEIKPACHKCGVEVEDLADVENMDTSLDRAVTFAPVSKISYSGGGCTFNPNSDREHKNFMWKVVNERNILFSELQKNLPILAAKFKVEPVDNSTFEVVHSKDHVYCRIGQFVRRITKEEYYFRVGQFRLRLSETDFFNKEKAFWHRFDAPLQKSKLGLIIEPKSEFRRSKEYALRLLEKYGFNNKDRDQTVYNTVGRDIERLKPFVDARMHHVSEKTFAETVVYICLLRFGKNGIAKKVKSELDINIGLVNFIDDVLELLREDAVKVDNNPVLLDALEHQSSTRQEL